MNNACRLCSVNRNLIHAFDEPHTKNLKMIRYVIRMATGVEIKETDKASKMVCQRCCEIAVKIHKYRTNAIINDKFLKERSDQPYTPSVMNQEEILRLSTEIINEHMASIRQNSFTLESLKSKTVSSRLLKQPSSSTKAISSRKHPSLRLNRIVREVAYRHPSVRKLYKQYNNIIVPIDVFKSDVSPVISIDSTEVSDWYAEQASNIQKRLTDIIIKKIPWESASGISSSDENPNSIPNYMQSSVDETDYDHFSINASNSNDDGNVINAFLFSYEKEKQSPSMISKTVNQRAKKKTTRKLHSSRKRSIDDDVDEVIPEKKIRSFNNKEVKNVSNKVDLPNQLPSDKKEQKTIFTSSLELTPVVSSPVDQISAAPSSSLFSESTRSVTTLSSLLSTPVTLSSTPKSCPVAPLFEQVDCQNVMAAEKTLSIFICSMCNQLCDTKKELQDHERIHLTCKFCKMRIKNLALLQQHQNETCFINIVKNPPNLQLTRVDSIKSVVQKYSEAFEVLSSQQEESDLSQQTLDNTSAYSITDFVAADMNTSEMEGSASTSNQSTVGRKPTIISNDNQKVTDRIKQAKSSTQEIVSLLDECGDVVLGSEISKAIAKLPIKANVEKEASTTSPNKVTAISMSSSKLNMSSKPQNYANEKEMIQSLFTKYNSSSLKCNASSKTSTIPSNAVVCTNTNLIILEDVLSELDKYKIPVSFSFKPRVSAKFQEQPLVAEERILESWKDKKVLDVQKQAGSSSYIRTTPSNTVSLTLSNVTLNGAKVAITAQKDTGSLLMNKRRTNSPIVLNNSTYSKNTIATEPANASNSHSLGQLSLVTLPTTPTAIIAQTSNTQNLSAASLILNPTSTLPNVLPCPALYVPQSGALIQNTQQNEKIIPASSSVSSVGKYVVLTTSGVAQQLSGINLEYLKCSSLATQKQALQLQQNQLSQQLTTVTPTTTATNATPTVKPQPATIRVKSLWELTQ